MQRLFIIGAAALCLVPSLFAEVGKMQGEFKLDGTLDESVWAAAKWESGFLRANTSRGGRNPAADTAFAILADDDYLYVGVKANHPDMSGMKARGARSIWTSEAVELYFIPDGGNFEYYQFLMTYFGEKYAMFYSEGGNIRPDPYGPFWEYRVADVEGGYTMEARIPLAAFYMTRTAAWKTSWKVNVGRTLSLEKGTDYNCWVDGSGFKDIKRFRSIDGFPVRKTGQDALLKSVISVVEGKNDEGKLFGKLKLGIYVAEGGEYAALTSFTDKEKFNLKSGDNELSFDAHFPGNGRNPMKFVLQRRGDKPMVREYPVIIDYQALRLKLDRPGYRANFYPGQDASKVAGRIVSAVKGEVSVSITGPGFEPRSVTLPSGGGEFAFDTTGFEFGEALLEVKCNGETLARKIRRLEPLGEGKHVSWIEDGCLVVDGKKVFRRNMYAQHYRGGMAFAEKYDADLLHLDQTLFIKSIGTFEPMRLVKGAEQREARKDQRPSEDIFAAMDKVIERGLKGDGSYYYISDEPECRQVSPVYLKYMYDYAIEKDPYHVVLCGSRAGLKYLDCADWFETHPYLNPHRDADGKRVYGRHFRELGTYVDAFKPEEHPEKCIGCMPTCFKYSIGEFPTFREYVTHTWNFLIHGVRTFYPYAYHDLGDSSVLYEGVRFTNETADRLSDFFLTGKRRRLEVGDKAEAAEWTLGDRRLYAVANFTGGDITVQVPVAGEGGECREFRGSRRFAAAGGKVQIELSAYEAIAFSRERLDEGLSTYAEISEKVAALEYERLHRDNQLQGHEYDIELATSNSANGRGKLFDGVRDVLAWSDNRGKGRFYEISFNKFVPCFDKLALYGRGIEGFKVKIRHEGGWKTLEPVQIDKVEEGLVYHFDRAYSTVKLHLDLPSGGKFELYELELPKTTAESGHVVQPVRQLDSKAAEKVFWSKTPPATFATNVFWYVDREPGQDFLVFDFKRHRVVKDGKYINWGIFFNKTGGGKHGHLAGDVTRPQNGYYTLRLPPVTTKCRDVMIIRDYNLEMELGEIACVSKPADFAEFLDYGDRFEIKVSLSRPCEDITCNFTASNGAHPIAYPVNGSASVDLKPLDDTRCRWGATVEVKSRPETKARPGIKVTVLGGGLERPIFTNALVQ